MADQESPAKEIRRRSRNACDACRARKVKCIALDGPICQACQELTIPCLHEIPRKRRGPANQYALAQRQARSSMSLTESPSPAAGSTRGSERLAPMPVIEQMIQDWFNLIHSVAPIFHRGIFLTRLASGEASNDGIFAALVVAVCAATIASLKRRSTMEYGGLTVDKCLAVVEQIELSIGKQRYSLDWCQMNYHLGVALLTERALDDPESYRLFSASCAAVKYMLYYDLPRMSHVEQQLLKRQFWLLFAGCCTMDLHGRPYVGILTPSDNINALMPIEVSDNELDPTQPPGEDSDWHGNNKSYIPGLNYLCKLFLLWHESQQAANRTIDHLQHYSNLVQRALDYLPPELKWRGGLSRPPQSNFGTDVQTANLYITQLHLRSNLLEQMNQQSKSTSTPSTPPEITNERQSIIEDMLEILYHMPQETLEANGHSLIPKIRDIGSALLDEVRTGYRDASMSTKASANLERLLAKLETLDAHSRSHYMEMGPFPGVQL